MNKSTKTDQVTYEVLQIPLARIRAFEFQPRKWFDPQEIQARAQSMRALGQQDPVTVERVLDDPDHDFELINGESRLRSAHKAGIKTLWAAVRSRPFPSRAEKHMASLVANFNRSDHTPMEISDALFVQVSEGGKTQHEIAQAIGKPEMWVSHYLSLQKLHADIKPLLHPTVHKDKRLAPAVGFELSMVPTERQLEVLEAARGADGRVTRLRVQIETDRTLGKRTRALSPSKRREKMVNTVRAIRLDLAKLQAVIGADVGEAIQLLRDDSTGGTSVIEEGILALQSVRATISRQEKQRGVSAPKVMDTARMTDDERAAYIEKWRQFWTTFPMPAAGKREPLLLEVAYPKYGPRERERSKLSA